MSGSPPATPFAAGSTAAWIASRASSRGRRWRALGMMPVVTLIFTGAALSGRLHVSDDRTGAVIVSRYRPFRAVAVPVVVLGVTGGVAAALLTAAGLSLPAAVGVLLGVGLVPFAAYLVAAGGLAVRAAPGPVGPGTPTGPRYVVEGLVQAPGTRLSAVLLARAVLGNLAPGSVVVAVADDDELLDRYRRLGFTVEDEPARRVFRVL